MVLEVLGMYILPMISYSVVGLFYASPILVPLGLGLGLGLGHRKGDKGKGRERAVQDYKRYFTPGEQELLDRFLTVDTVSVQEHFDAFPEGV